MRLADPARDRELPTTLYAPGDAEAPVPLIVFGHGFTGHPRKFTKLLGAWAQAGYAVAAPAFPLTNDEAPGEPVFDDVANQPADVSFVIDALLAAADVPVDRDRIGVGGFSLGAITALAVGFNRRFRDPRVRAVAALAGGFWEALGGTYDMDGRPLLVVHGTADSVVPYAMGEAVYRAARPPKVLVALEGGRHHEEFEDGSGPLPSIVETTLAFWDVFLRGDRGASDRLLAERRGAHVQGEGV